MKDVIYLAILGITVAYSFAESPVYEEGTCPNFISDDTEINLYNKTWYELYRSNRDSSRRQWCGNEFIFPVNNNVSVLLRNYYDVGNKTQLSLQYIFSGSKGHYNYYDPVRDYCATSTALLASNDLFIEYFCTPIGDNIRVVQIYVYGILNQITAEINTRIQNVLAYYGLPNNLVASIQEIPECEQVKLTEPRCRCTCPNYCFVCEQYF